MYGDARCDWEVAKTSPINKKALEQAVERYAAKHGISVVEAIEGDFSVYPLLNNFWWRLKRSVKPLYDEDVDGPGGKKDWHCPTCVNRWDWGTHGHERVFIIGDPRMRPRRASLSAAKGTSMTTRD